MKQDTTSHRPKVLYLSPDSPSAYNAGGRMRCAFIADALSACAELCVWVLGDKVPDSDPTKRTVPWEQHEFGSIADTFFRKVTRYARGLFPGAPILSYKYLNGKRTKLLIDKLISFKPDIVILGDSHICMAEPTVRTYAPHAAIVLDSHNVDWLLYDRLANTATTRFQALKLKRLSRCIKQTETSAITSCNEVWAVSAHDAREFIRLAAHTVHVIPNAIPLEEYHPEALSGNRAISFVGWYDYPPNEQAALFLISCSHSLMKMGISHTLSLIGRDPTPRMLKQAAQADYIRIVGEVRSAPDEMLKSDIFAAPMFAGSGTKFKVIEALALGRAVVTTPLGNEGLELRCGKEALICQPDEFLDNLQRLLDTPGLAQSLGRDGRTWIEMNLSPSEITTKIAERVSELATRPPRRA